MADVREKSCTILAHFQPDRLRTVCVTSGEPSLGEIPNQQRLQLVDSEPSGCGNQNPLSAVNDKKPSGGEILNQLSAVSDKKSSGGGNQNPLSAVIGKKPSGGEILNQLSAGNDKKPSGGGILNQLTGRMEVLLRSPKDRRCESGAALAKLITIWAVKVSQINR